MEYYSAIKNNGIFILDNIYVHICTYMCVYTYIHIYTYIYTHTYIHIQWNTTQL